MLSKQKQVYKNFSKMKVYVNDSYKILSLPSIQLELGVWVDFSNDNHIPHK